jgi:hypothetical protein
MRPVDEYVWTGCDAKRLVRAWKRDRDRQHEARDSRTNSAHIRSAIIVRRAISCATVFNFDSPSEGSRYPAAPLAPAGRGSMRSRPCLPRPWPQRTRAAARRETSPRRSHPRVSHADVVQPARVSLKVTPLHFDIRISFY